MTIPKIAKRNPRPMEKSHSRSIFVAALMLSVVMPGFANAEELTLGGAIERALNKSPSVQAQRVLVDSARGTVTQAAGLFDWNTSLVGDIANVRTGAISATTLTESTTSYRTGGLIAGIGRKYRQGFDVELTSTMTSDRNKSVDIGYVGTNTLALVVTFPLLKGFGYDATTATERAAKKTLEAARLSSGSEISNDVYDVVVLYWSTLAAQLSENALKGTFKRSDTTTKILKDRVDGGLIAPVEYSRSLAELRLREIDLEDGGQDLFETRSNLMASFGEKKDPNTLETVTAFPIPASSQDIEALVPGALVKIALENRLDMRALKVQLEAASINLAKAKDDMNPDLDLALSQSLATGGRNYKYSDNLDLYKSSDNINPSTSLMLSFSYPLGNRVAKGAVTSSRADRLGIELDIKALKALIHSEVGIALDKLERSQRNYTRAKESEKVLTEVQNITMDKLTRGEATMTDLISVEDRLTEGRLKVIDGMSKYAQALASLKLVTGTLTSEHNELLTIKPEVFLNLPVVKNDS